MLFSGLCLLKFLDGLSFLLFCLLLYNFLLFKSYLGFAFLGKLLFELLHLLVIDFFLLLFELVDIVLFNNLLFELMGLLLDDIHIVEYLLLALLHLLHVVILERHGDGGRGVLDCWKVFNVCIVR